MSDAEALKLARNEWDRNGALVDETVFLSDLSAVRGCGLAYDLDEHSSGVSAIGFAFADWSGDVHAISVPVPSSRFADRRTVIEAALKETAANIQATFE